jgi:hypothetical protein
MKTLALAAALLASTAIPAAARLQLTVSDGTQTFSCFDGELSCDSSGGANNLALLNPFSDGTEVQFTLTQSTFGSHNILQLSSSNIDTSVARTITFIASDTNFVDPTSFIKSSASLTFNQNIGAPDSTLKFWADTANTQGANPTNTPGTLLETVSGHATTDPDSFSGSLTDPFFAHAPFSMTEGASLALIAGGSVTGFNQSEISGVPEPGTWALMGVGFGLMALLGLRRGSWAKVGSRSA